MNKKGFSKIVFVLIFSIIFSCINIKDRKVEAAPGSEAILGQICLMAINYPPRGWAICNGDSLNIRQNPALFALLGINFGGDGTTTFKLPKIDSPIPGTMYCISVQGLYPSRPEDGSTDSGQLLGQIELFPYNFTPGGWSRCEGQSLNINQNSALFAILGTKFGGNGTTNFQLPNLKGTEPDPNLHYCIALQGSFPTEGSYSYNRGGEELIGSIDLFPPRSQYKNDVGLCDGGILNISSYNVLQGCIGNVYGGDGITTFGKPDLSGATPNPELSYYIQTMGTYPTRN